MVWVDGWKGQLGQEETPELFVSHLCDIFDEVKRVLKPEGVLFVNIDDSYGDNKSLMGIPEIFLLQMINRGWILRNKIVYAKPNPMPESVKDRFTCDWEPVFFFTKQEKYYFEQQFEPMAESNLQRALYPSYVKTDTGVYGGMDIANQMKAFERILSGNNQRNKRCVWTIATGSTGFEMCQSCQRIYSSAEFDNLPKKVVHHKHSGKRPPGKIDQALEGRGQDLLRPICHCGSSDFISHYASFPVELCITPILAGSPEGGTVLDPFAGSGTLGVAARRLGRKAILIDVSEPYVKMAAYRIQMEPLPLFGTIESKTQEVAPKQLSLFEIPH